MLIRVISQLSLRDSILQNYTPKRVVLPDVRVDITFDDPMGKLEAALSADPLLSQRMVAKLQGLLHGDLAKLMAHTVAMTDLNILTFEKDGKQELITPQVQQLGRQLDLVKAQIIPKIQNAATTVIAELAAKRKEYRNYQIKAGVNIGLGVLGVGASVAGIALSMGGSSLISLIGIVRGLSEIVQQCKSLYDDAEDVSSQVHSSIRASMKNRSSNEDINALLEVGRAVVKALSTVDAVATPEKCEGLNGTFRMKLMGLEVGSHDASESLEKLLEANAGLVRLSRQANNPVLAVKLEEAEIKVQLLIGKIHDLVRRVEIGELQQKFYAAIIAEMKRGVASWGVPVATAAKLLINTGIGLGSGAASGAIDGNIISGLPFGSTAANLAGGAVGTGKIIAESTGLLLELYGDYQEIAELFGAETAEQVRKAYPLLEPVKSGPPPLPPRPAKRTPPPVPPRPAGFRQAPPPIPPRGPRKP